MGGIWTYAALHKLYLKDKGQVLWNVTSGPRPGSSAAIPEQSWGRYSEQAPFFPKYIDYQSQTGSQKSSGPHPLSLSPATSFNEQRSKEPQEPQKLSDLGATLDVGSQTSPRHHMTVLNSCTS